MGCVRKRRGKWVADYRDPSGKRRWITRETKREAEAALASAKVAIQRNEYVAPDHTRRLFQVYDHWWRLCVVGSDNKRGKPVSLGTQGFYAGLWARYFLPPEHGEAIEGRFAPRQLRSIHLAEVAEWKEALSQRVGPRTVIAALGLLDTLFRHARRFGWAVTNPLESLHRPRHKAKVRALTPGELAALIANAGRLERAPADTALLLKVKASSGLRASELFGIRPKDIDFATGRIHLTRQLQDGVALELKSEKSRRDVFLPSAVLKELREHPRRFIEDEPLFVTREGRPHRLSNFHRDVWRPLLKAAGIATKDERGRVTFHSLRHSTATALIAAGENPVTVASLLGHANPQVTLTVYADAWAARVEHSAEGIADVLFGQSGSKSVASGDEHVGSKEPDRAQVVGLPREVMVGRVGVEPTTKRLRVLSSQKKPRPPGR